MCFDFYNDVYGLFEIISNLDNMKETNEQW